MSATTVTFLGLGQMGLPMARNLIAAGFALRTYNRDRTKAAALEAEGAAVTDAPAALPGGIAVSMLANDAALEAVSLAPGGLVDTLGPGGLHISMSTVGPETSRALARAHAERGSLFLAAPVFGRPEAAAAKKLWICQAGAAAAKERAAPVLAALSQGVFDFGEDPGAAGVVKLAGNFLILSAIEALSEALALGEKHGVDRAALANLFAGTLFSCPIYQNYGRIVAERRFEPAGFKLELGLKDMRLVRDAAEAKDLPMPLADLLRARLLSGMAKGRAAQDWTAIERGSAEDGALT